MKDMAPINQDVTILLILVADIFVFNGTQFDWLEYSPSVNKAFCFVCRVFGRTSKQHEAFVSTGFQKWKSALEKFRAHQSSAAHKTAVLTWKTAQRTRNNPETNVVTLVNYQKRRKLMKTGST